MMKSNLFWKKFHTNSTNGSCVDLKMVGFLLGLHKISLLLVFVGQHGKNKAMDKKKIGLCAVS